jgi:trigger factor
MSRASSHSHAQSHAHDEHDHPGLSVAVEKKPGKAEVTFTIAADELERARGKEYAALSRRVSLKGFRPGKTPRAMLEKHFSADVEKSLVEHFLQHAYEKAVADGELRPAAFPRIDLGENVPKKGADWSHAFEILLRPDVALGQIEGLEIEGKPVDVTDEEVENALGEIRRANSRAEPTEDGLLEDGMALATLDFFRADTAESCLTREGMRLSPKTPPHGVDPAIYEQTLTGAKAGEERELEMTFPDNFPVEEARGERGKVRFALTGVMRIVPPSDEELFKAFEATDDASLRVKLKERMLVAKHEAEEQRIETELLERQLEAHPLELPEQLVLDQVEAQQADLRDKLSQQGLGEEEAAARAESERARSHATAERGLRAVYLIEEIARVKELKVTQDDVATELNAIAERNDTTAAEVAKYYKEQGLLRQLGLELLERKVRRYLRATAAVKLPG